MARRRRTHHHLLEALEPRSYLSVAPGGPTVAVGVNLADGTPTRLYRTPALLQSKGNGSTLKATPTSVQSAQAYFDVIMGYPPPTLNSGPTASFVDPSETTAALSVAATSGSPDSKLTFAWAVQSGPNANAVTFSDNNDDSALNTIATFHAAGDYVFTVTVSDGVRITTGTVGIEVDSIATSIVVVPGMTQGAADTLSPNGSSPFAAVVSDQFGQAMNSAAVSWSLDSGSIGTISSSGIYQAPAQSGSATIRATAGSLTNALTITVANHAPVIISAASAGSSNVTGTSTTLNVLGSDDGGESGLTYSWSLTAQPANATTTFADNNDNSAKATTVTFSKAGSYTFLVTVSDGSLTTTSSVTLNVVQKVTSIAVSATNSNLNLNGSTTLTATAYDQFGAALTTQPTFTWSKAGVGSVNAAGVFAAGATSGGSTVTASAGGVSGSAAVTVANAAPTIATPASGPTTVTTNSAVLSVLGADDGGESGLTYSWALISGPAGVAFSSNGANASKNTSVTFTRAGNYSFQVTVSDGSLTTTSSLTLQVVQTLSSIVVTPGSFSLALNQTRNLLATAYDQFGQQMIAQPSITWSKVSGVGSVDSTGVYTSGATAGVVTIQALAGGVSGTATASVGNTAPTVVNPASGPATVTTTNATLSVLGADDGGENNLTYTWSLTASPTGGTANFSANGTNASKSTVVTFNKAGTYTFLVTLSDGSLTTTSSVTLTVAQTLSSIVVTPGSASLNLNGTRSLSAVAYDQFNAAMSTQPGFTWTKSSGVGSVNASGTYSAGTTAGGATITASAGGVSGSATMTVTNAAPTIATPAAGPSTITGTTATLTVLGADDGGESGLTYSWSLTSEPTVASPTFSANGTNGAKSTVVTFNRAGSYTFLVTVSDGSLTTTSSVTLTVVQTISSINVSPTPVLLHLNGTQTLTATGYDQFGLAMSTQPTFTWSKTSGVGSVNSSGTYSAGTTAGGATITASAGGVSGSATITVTNAAPTIATPASGPGTITGKTATLTVLGADDGGEAGLTYSWSLTSVPTGGNATFSANGTNAAKSTVATFSEAGSYSFLVTVSDGSLTVTSSVTVTVNQALTTIGVSPASSNLSANGSETLTATGYDQFGQALTVQPAFTWTLTAGNGSVNSAGVYTAGAAGSGTITASSGGVSGTATVSVANQAPTIATPASGPSTVGISSANLSVLGADDGGESHLTYTWSIVSDPTGASPSFSINGTNAAKNTMVLFNRAGTYTFLVTVSDGSLTATSSVTLTVTQTMTSIQVSPGTQTLNAYAVQQFSATAYDQFGQMLTTQPTFTWTVDSGGDGTVASGGAFTAGGTSGTATVRATSGSVSGTAAVTVSATSGNAAVVTTRNMTSFTELVITGTSGNDTINVSESGNTFTIISNGITQTVTGTFGDLAIHAGSGGSTITIASNVTINTLLYGGAGSDTLNDFATGSYNAIVSIGGGTDTLTGNGVNTNYWADTADTVNASAGEISAGYVHAVGQFFQPWTTDTTSPDYVSLQLQGQDLRDPSDAGAAVRYTNASLWGTAPAMTDVRQGAIDDCYFLAGIQSLALATPYKLMSKAVDLGDGTYVVEFNQGTTKIDIRVDGDFSGLGSQPSSSNALWPLVFEKAFAFFRHPGTNTYASLNSGGTTEPFSDLGLTQTATSTAFIAYDPADFASQMNSYLAAGRALTVSTPASILNSAPLVASHAYSLVAVQQSQSGPLFVLRNPWGIDGVSNDADPLDGLVTLTATQFMNNCAVVFEAWFS